MAELKTLLRKCPKSRLYGLYPDSMEYFANHPPGDGWDGVFNFQTK